MKDLAIAAALAGGKVLRDLFGTSLEVSFKGEIDLVTNADRAAEESIVALLHSGLPDADILAEEGTGRRNGSVRQWIVDPLDGTTNYAHGFPWFAVSLALQVAEETLVGVVYQPITEELFVAEKGRGATLNGRPLRVSATATLEQSLLATGFPYDRKESPVNNYDHFVQFQQAAQACRRPGAASLDLASVAAGRFDGYWEMKLKPWDMAAGQLLVEEAGGRVSDFSGSPLNLFGAECLASNGHIHAGMMELLQRGRRP